MDQEALTRALAALGHPIRMSLYRRLAASGAAGSGPVALAASEGIRHNLVSYHLQPLVAAGLVESERRGREVNYRLAPRGMQALTADMMRLSEAEA